MHLITSFKSRTMTALPSALPPGLYEAASRRGQPAPRAVQAGVPRQFTGSQKPASPLARSAQFPAAQPQSAQTTGQNWLVSPQEKAKYDQFFDSIDTGKTGFLDGEQAVKFFNDSGLSEDALASIWDLSDVRSEGRLNREEFAVAMYLIRQQRSGAPLPAFLPAALIPPSMRGQGQQPQPPSLPPTAAFDNTTSLPQASLPQASKSAADDLFGLDSSPTKPTAAPAQNVQTTGSSVRGPFDNDPFNDKAATFTPQTTGPVQNQQSSSMFKPFQPTSAFGASIATQNTGGSVGSPKPQNRGFQPPPQLQKPSASDDLLGDHDEEQSKQTQDTTELANLSSQIGNLRNQMQDVQTKKTTNERDLAATNAQKQELQQRLAQFRAQYEQAVQTVKSLEQELNTSKTETRKLQQDLAMLEGTHHDLQAQHSQISQALEADRTENTNLKTRISQLNAEVSQLRPQIDKMKSEARQQKGMVAINKKQLATNEGERDRLNTEMADLTKAHEAEQARSAAASPASQTMASPTTSVHTNPFFRKASQPGVPDGVQSPNSFLASAPSPSAFDALFGPARSGSQSHTATPKAQSAFPRPEEHAAVIADRSLPSSSPEQLQRSGTPSATEPPPPPESRQFTPQMLPVNTGGSFTGSATSSTKVVPSASGFEGLSTPKPESAGTSARGVGSAFADLSSGPSLTAEPQQPSFTGQRSVNSLTNDHIPGAFPSEGSPQKQPTPTPGNVNAPPPSDFDDAFSGLEQSTEHQDGNADVFGPRGEEKKKNEDFYPMTAPADETDSSDDEAHGFEDNFAGPSKAANGVAGPANVEAKEAPAQSSEPPPPSADAIASPPAYSPRPGADPSFPDEFHGLLPSRSDPTASPNPHSRPSVSSQHQPNLSGGSSLFPASAASDVFEDASSRPLSTFDQSAPVASSSAAAQPSASKSAPFGGDDFDEFDDLAEAQPHSGEDKFDFADNRSDHEFNPNFDSPAASMTTAGIPGSSTHGTPFASTHNGFNDFGGSSTHGNAELSSAFASSTPTASNNNHDWDAIFSGLDNVATTPPSGVNATGREAFAATPKAPAASSPPATATAPPNLKRMMTTASEHDDPILQRLVGMGYSRSKALSALEKYDYDINRVCIPLIITDLVPQI